MDKEDRNLYIKQINSDYITPVIRNTNITIPSIKDTVIPLDSTIFVSHILLEQNASIELTSPTGNITTIASDIYTSGSAQLTELGLYVLRYYGKIQYVSGNIYITSDFTVAFYISVVLNYDPLPLWNIRSVIDRVCNVIIPHKEIEPPFYKLDPAQAEEFEKILAPEFAFTQLTFKEILDQIGGYIHGVPRLIKGESGKFDTIHYDMLGGTEVAPLSNPKYQYVTEIRTQNVENYCTALDSTIENLVNSLEAGAGSITEPYRRGFKTVRSDEAYARIEEGNMVIATSLPIYTVQKLEVYVREGENAGQAGDITPYVFEGAEYGRLSSFDGNYPTSKAFAIYYNLGERNIKGLSFKSPTVIGGAESKYSIANIIKEATGWNIGDDWWKDANYPTLAFRITYTPIFSDRVVMHKSYHEAGAPQRTLIYNQGANLVETKYYGENLKGVIARMGNESRIRTYLLANVKSVPKVGQLWGDDYYVAAVTCALYCDCIECTVELSKDFNRLSQFIGINSEWRAYEVSEKKAYNRNIVYSDYGVIGNASDVDINVGDDVSTLITFSGAQAIIASFNATDEINPIYLQSVSASVVRCYDENSAQFAANTLPIISTAFGNVMSFEFGMANNYSAGAKSVPDSAGSASGYWQTDATYTDYYGGVDSVSFSMYAYGSAYSEDTALELPQGSHGGTLPFISCFAQDKMVVDKNGGEILNFNYELQYVAVDPKIIIGSALTHKCSLIGGAKSGQRTALYIVPKRIGKFADKIDLSTATKLFELTGSNAPTVTNATTTTRLRITFPSVVPSVGGAAWAIADIDTGEIFIARNGEVTANASLVLPAITFMHKLP